MGRQDTGKELTFKNYLDCCDIEPERILKDRKDTPIYIDSDLGNGLKGENIAKELHTAGFANLTMATGHGPKEFAHFPWLQVTGKEPPWA